MIEISLVRDNGRPVTLDKSIDDRFFVSKKPTAGGKQGQTAESVVSELLKWDVPAGWEQLPAKQFRSINLRVGSSECYLSILTGGGVNDNLNRWRQQMGQPPLTTEEIAKLEKVQIFGRQAHLLDVAGIYSGMGQVKKPEHRMKAVYAQFPQFAISVKMIGPDAEVVAQSQQFRGFLKSLDFDREKAKKLSDEPGEGAHGSGGSLPGNQGGGAKPQRSLAWDVPTGWTKGTGSSMRYVTFDMAGGVQCYITFLPGTVGGVLANMNRWLGEVGEPHIDQAAADALPKLSILQAASPYLASYGKKKGVLVALTPLPGETMFVKLTGETAAVKAQVSQFESFCKSIRKSQ